MSIESCSFSTDILILYWAHRWNPVIKSQQPIKGFILLFLGKPSGDFRVIILLYNWDDVQKASIHFASGCWVYISTVWCTMCCLSYLVKSVRHDCIVLEKVFLFIFRSTHGLSHQKKIFLTVQQIIKITFKVPLLYHITITRRHGAFLKGSNHFCTQLNMYWLLNGSFFFSFISHCSFQFFAELLLYHLLTLHFCLGCLLCICIYNHDSLVLSQAVYCLKFPLHFLVFSPG